jgi:hypothetical protein
VIKPDKKSNFIILCVKVIKRRKISEVGVLWPDENSVFRASWDLKVLFALD